VPLTQKIINLSFLSHAQKQLIHFERKSPLFLFATLALEINENSAFSLESASRSKILYQNMPYIFFTNKTVIAFDSVGRKYWLEKTFNQLFEGESLSRDRGVAASVE
jgi:hypothetical protein